MQQELRSEKQDTLTDLSWRYAVKSFNPQKKLTPQQIDLLSESFRLTPSSFGLQPWKLIVVNDDEIKSKLRSVSWNQAQVEQCSHHLVLAGKLLVDDAYVTEYISSLASHQQTPREQLAGLEKVIKGFISNMSLEEQRAWIKNQVYLALGQLLLTCAQNRIDACPMEGINPVEYDRILDLTNRGLFTVCACPVGYRSDQDPYAKKPKSRFPLSQVVSYLPATGELGPR